MATSVIERAPTTNLTNMSLTSVVDGDADGDGLTLYDCGDGDTVGDVLGAPVYLFNQQQAQLTPFHVTSCLRSDLVVVVVVEVVEMVEGGGGWWRWWIVQRTPSHTCNT